MLDINSIYSFSTRAPNILGESFKNMKLSAVFDYSLAVSFTNIDALHTNIYPLLPQGIVDDPSKYKYYYFITEDNKKIVLADVWIDNETITSYSTQSLLLEIPNISNTDIERIRSIMNTLGIVYNIKIV